MLSFAEYRADYKSKLSKGKKFILSDFNKSWNEYKISNSKVLSDVSVEKPQESPLILEKKEVKAEKPIITVEPQSDNILQNNIIVSAPKEPISPQSTVKAQMEVKAPNEAFFSLEELEDIADALHQTIANIIEVVSDGKVKINTKTISRLNRFGSKLLKKYDSNGLLEKYGLEIAYGATVLGVAIEIMVTYQVTKSMNPADNTNKAVSSDSNLIAMMEQLKEQHAREVRDLKNIIAKNAEVQP